MSDKKMDGKQDTVGAFDLDVFVGGADQEEATEPAPKPASKPVKAEKRPKPPVEAKKPASAGKSKPQKAEKVPLSERVQVRMTRAEFEKLEGQAGLVPVSTFLRKFMQDNGLI